VPKAPLKAQIVIGLFAVLMIAYGFSIIRLDEGSTGTRNALPGQLIVVRLDSPWASLASSDNSVVVAVSITLSPNATGYFLALRPGRATLTAVPAQRCTLCREPPPKQWTVHITVGPGG
jgi:hypothetical protein